MTSADKYVRACIGLSLAYEEYKEAIIQRDFTDNERDKRGAILHDWLIEYKRSKSELVSGDKAYLVID